MYGPGAHRHRRYSQTRTLLLTAASAVLPGTAHIMSGRRRSGVAIAAAAAGLAGGAAGFLLTRSSHDLVGLAVRPGWLTAVAVAGVALAVAWVAVVLSSYVVLRRSGGQRPGPVGRAVAAAVLLALCAAVATPPLVAARYASLQRSVINSVFADTPVGSAAQGGSGGPGDWGGRERLNVLLIASDAGPDRRGTRTDSLVLASIDVRTHDVLLLSLPRNLQHAPMPPGPLRDTWPHGFPDLLNAVYERVTDRPGLLAGARDRGATAVKAVVGEILGLRVDYYALANMQGFEDFINALGGVTLTVKQRLPIGGLTADGRIVPPDAWIEPGRQRLDGYHAIWYARSRRNSDDYDRMARQRCLLGALARQADPVRVLRNFQSLAAATKKLAETDIPRGLLPALVSLADAVHQHGAIRSVTFVPPFISTAEPDFALIRSAVRRALAAAPRADGSPASPAAAPDSGSSGRAAGPARTRSPAAGARSTPAPTAQPLSQVCALD